MYLCCKITAMERKDLNKFFEWKHRKKRKPLIVYGARQVGKTWLMQEFARQAFQKYVYINFEDEERLSGLFEKDFDIDRIIATISIVKNVDIDADTLLIFDEIQAVKRGITSLKYFYEKAPRRYVMAAGSLLGIAQHQGDSFPVGKVDSIYLSPMDFEEFLLATNRKREALVLKKQQWDVIDIVKDKLQTALREYYLVGGMPAVVAAFCEHRDFSEIRRLQNDIIGNYERDFSKHAPANEVPRIRMVWDSIFPQLSKENRKFTYSALKRGARAKEFEVAIAWLLDAGLIRKVPRVNKAEMPLKAFEDASAFKLFLVDIGLFCAMGHIPYTALIDGHELFLTAKGALTEQFVSQQILSTRDLYAGYWSAENSRGEIDFLIQYKDEIIPIEVKAEENLKSKSLRAFVEKNPKLYGMRLSMSNFRKQDWMTNYPLYSLPFIFEKQ